MSKPQIADSFPRIGELFMRVVVVVVVVVEM